MPATAGQRLLDAIAEIQELTKDRTPQGLGHNNADDVLGTIDCDDAIGFDPLPLLRALDRHGARAVVIGQVAGILHGSTELTGDLDLLWSGEPDEAAAVMAGLEAAGASLFDDDDAPVDGSAEAFALPKLTFRTTGAAGDFCTPALPWGELDVAAFIDRADSTMVDGTTVHYVNRQDLIAMREAVGREKDVRRAAELRAI